jgi:hypothetical protein
MCPAQRWVAHFALRQTNRRGGFALLVVSMSVLGAGCGTHEAENSGGSDQTGFASRLDAAKGIGNNATRDEALSKLAIDAAANGDGEITRKAVDAIFNSATKSEVASRSALKLGKAGKGDEANAVARLIFNNAIRDETLAKIAKGQFGE